MTIANTSVKWSYHARQGLCSRLAAQHRVLRQFEADWVAAIPQDLQLVILAGIIGR